MCLKFGEGSYLSKKNPSNAWRANELQALIAYGKPNRETNVCSL